MATDLWTPKNPDLNKPHPSIWTPDIETEVPNALEQIHELARVKYNPYHFFENYVYILDSTTNRIIKYEFWEHLQFLIAAMIKYPLVLVMKSKQIGVSWTLAGIAYEDGYKTGANVLEISAGQIEAAELLDKSRKIRSYLPKFLQLELDADGAELISFKATKARIRALPSTKGAGLGQTASRVISDENDFHAEADDNYANLKPTTDAGTPYIAVTTMNGDKSESLFRTLWAGAKEMKNGFYPIFMGYDVRPGRDEKWYVKTALTYPDQYQVEKNYPRSEEEALSPRKGNAVFDVEILTKLGKECEEAPEIRPGGIHIYLKPEIGVHYIAGVDMAAGVGEANSVLWIEGQKGLQKELCAIFCSNSIHPDVFTQMSFDLLKEYFSPLVVSGGGSDSYGKRFLDGVLALGYSKSKIYCSDKKKEKLGYNETKTTQRDDVIKLEAAIRGGLRVRYKPAIMEMLSYQHKDGEVTVPAGAKKDIVMAACKVAMARKDSSPIGDVPTPRPRRQPPASMFRRT